MDTRVLIIIITYNAINWIYKCLSSVYYDVNNDVFIVDNGSIDGTQEYILANFPKVKFFQSSENIGFGKANNIGIKYAIDNDYKYIYLLNQDAWIEENTIKELIAVHKNNQEYGILSPFQIQANMSSLDKNFGEIVCAYNSNHDILNDLIFKRKKDVYEVPFVMAAHWLISRKCFYDVGGFSPTFPHYGEDNNYINRAVFHGYKVGVVPNCIGVHDREDRKENLDKKLYMNYIGILIGLSNINRLPKRPVLYSVIYTMFAIVRNRSVKPISYCFKILCKWNTIQKNIKYSKALNAFID